MNNFKPLDERYFNKKSIANNEDMKVVVRATISGKKPNEWNSLKEEMNSTIADSDIAGMPKKKENFTASAFFQPEINAVAIVMPDLEKPGMMAND